MRLCSPGSGQKLKYGKAMQARASHVELPGVTALFADISSRGAERQRRWSPKTPSTPRVRAVYSYHRVWHFPHLEFAEFGLVLSYAPLQAERKQP